MNNNDNILTMIVIMMIVIIVISVVVISVIIISILSMLFLWSRTQNSLWVDK